jgi:putative membrane protein
MVLVPILLWTVGPAALPWVVAWNVIMLAAASTLVLVENWPARSVLWTLSAVLLGSWFIEFVGSTTGIPFGEYDYTNALQPQIGGVPLLIALAWLMMLPPVWAIAGLLAPHSRVAFIVIAAAALTAWDFFLDPQMVAWGFWTWSRQGAYFGIPLVNFAGWFLSAALLTVLARPLPLPVFPLIWVYTLTWALQTIGLGLFWAMPGPAVVGFLAMGAFVLLAWRRVLAPSAHRP